MSAQTAGTRGVLDLDSAIDIPGVHNSDRRRRFLG